MFGLILAATTLLSFEGTTERNRRTFDRIRDIRYDLVARTFDAAARTFSEPFLIPVREPADHRRRFLSYNVPEFSTGPVKSTPRALRMVK